MAGQKPAGQGSGRSRQGAAAKGAAKPATARPSGRAPVDQKPGTKTGTAKTGTAKNGTAKTGPAASGAAKARSDTANGTAKSRPAGAIGPAQPRPRRFGLLGSMGGLPLATWILSLYGLGASIYLTIAHYDTHVTLACSDKGFVNCLEVTTSQQSMVFGVLPVALLGLLFYVFMVVINSPWGWRLSQPAVMWARLGSVIVGMGFVLYLIYVEVVQIGAICLWCTSVHVATFLIFALMVFHYTFSWGKPAGTGRV